MKKNLYLLTTFIIASILGWFCEELYCFYIKKVFVNRGFLYGTYVPIYGFGAVLIVLLLQRFKKKPILVFLLSILITGILEYLTGYLLFSIYHRTWWNYKGMLLNIDGYVCLRSVSMFAVLSMVLMYIIEPFINKLIKNYYNETFLFSVFMLFVMMCDLIVTLIIRY